MRSHRGVENGVYWGLDVVFRDDLARLRSGNGAAKIAIFKCAAMYLLTQAKPVTSLKNRRKRTGWNQDSPEKKSSGESHKAFKRFPCNSGSRD